MEATNMKTRHEPRGARREAGTGKTLGWVAVVLLMLVLAAGCSYTKATTASPKQELIAYKAVGAPTLDGQANEAFWKDIKSTKITVSDGRVAEVKAAYNKNEIFMSIVWPGIPESGALRQWEFDGTNWKKEYG
jgi:hypothetical protein